MIGALLAYLMAPAVRILQRVLRTPWAAVLGAYLLLFAAVLVFGALLLTPFVTQAQSLVKTHAEPVRRQPGAPPDVRSEIGAVQAELSAQGQLLGAGRPIPQQQVQQTQTDIARLVRQVAGFSNDATSRRMPPRSLPAMRDHSRATGTIALGIRAGGDDRAGGGDRPERAGASAGRGRSGGRTGEQRLPEGHIHAAAAAQPADGAGPAQRLRRSARPVQPGAPDGEQPGDVAPQQCPGHRLCRRATC